MVMTVMLAAGALGTAACHKTFSGRATQPNPLVTPLETLRDSERIVIITADMELNLPRDTTDRLGTGTPRNATFLRKGKYPLHNEASFTVVSRDRLRFHVQLEHKWQEWADLRSWDVYLEDDQGHRYFPEQTERAHTRHLVSMWDWEARSVQRNRFGDIVQVNDDGYLRRQPLGSLSVFRGNADFVFYTRNIFTPDVKRLTLVVTRASQGFNFTWSFQDQDGTTTEREDPRFLVRR
jgi:hypothetical protein